MREGHLDKISNKVSKRASRLSDNLTLQLKGQKTPFREAISPSMKKWAWNNLGTQDMQELIKEFGYDSVNYLGYQVNKPDGRRL
jgi:hypothetical protein